MSVSSLWKLNVNRRKTKNVIFGSNARPTRNEYAFHYNDELLEIVTCYKYLSLIFEIIEIFIDARCN